MARNRKVEDDDGKQVNLQNLAKENRLGYDEPEEYVSAADEDELDIRPWAGIYADDEERRMVEEMEAAIDRRIAARPPTDRTATPAVRIKRMDY